MTVFQNNLKTLGIAKRYGIRNISIIQKNINNIIIIITILFSTRVLVQLRIKTQNFLKNIIFLCYHCLVSGPDAITGVEIRFHVRESNLIHVS